MKKSMYLMSISILLSISACSATSDKKSCSDKKEICTDKKPTCSSCNKPKVASGCSAKKM